MSDIEIIKETVEKVYPRGAIFMHKTDFSCIAPSPYVDKKGTHLIVNCKQASFVSKNPAVNGPKLILFLVSSAGLPENVQDEAYLEFIRNCQKEADKAKDATTAPVIAPPVADLPPPEITKTGNADIDAVLEAMNAKESVDDIKEYAVSTLGMPKFSGQPKKETVLKKITAHLLNKAETGE